LTELHDPDLIDIEYIQHFASNLGYNIDIYRNEVGISGTGTLGFGDFGEDSSLATDSEKYLRLMISNLPNWYKIKSTNNAIKVMLYSFGLIGDIVEYYSNNYLPIAEGGLWRLNANHDINEIPKNLILTASYGGRQDDLIEKHGLKNVIVYPNAESVPKDRPIDNNDDWARKPNVNFALLDNMKVSKKSQKNN
jgi:hypothetical protein